MSRPIIAYVSTVIRGSLNELSGFLIVIDWSKKQIINKISLPENSEHKYWNARGGNRGGRGIAFDKRTNILFVATATEVLKYSMDLKLIGRINHDYMAGIHDILLEKNGLWITSTVHDLVFKIDFYGKVIEEWWGSKSIKFKKLYSFNDRELNIKMNFSNKSFEKRYEKYCSEEIFHINSVASYSESIYILSNFKKSILQIKPVEKILITDNELISPHNICITDDKKVLINDTGNQCVNIYNFLSGKKEAVISTNITLSNEISLQFARAGWQRGLAYIKKDHYLVGTSPAQLFELNIATGEIIKQLVLDNNVRHCVHGLKVVEI